MFDQDVWRREVGNRVVGFARNPHQELQLAGLPSLLSYLVTCTLEPFLEAFGHEPVAAVLALADISRGPGADYIVRRATRMRYQSAPSIDRDLRSNRDFRTTAESLLVELQTMPQLRQRLNSSREVWLRVSLEQEMNLFPAEFLQLRRVVRDPSWQTRYEALRALRERKGLYSPADLVLIHDGLGDSAAHVRAASARALGMLTSSPPLTLVKAIVRVALHDSDVETRYAAAKALGMLREHVASPQLLDLFANALFDEDSFVRSSAAMVLGQLCEYAGAPMLVHNLVKLLDDDDAYVREAAARALGRIGAPAASAEVLAALHRVAVQSDVTLHDAALESLVRLREVRATMPIQLAVSA